MQSKLDLIPGNKHAVETARSIAMMLDIMHTRVIISGASVGTSLLFSAIEADGGIESRVRRLCLHDGSKTDEIKAVFAEAREVSDAVICLDNAECINSNELIVALMVELDEPAHAELSVFFLTRTPVNELEIAIRRRFMCELVLERASPEV